MPVFLSVFINAKFQLPNPVRTFIMPTNAVYSREEVAQHSTSDDAWIIIDNFVYDITKFARVHPGGTKIVLDYAGTLSEL